MRYFDFELCADLPQGIAELTEIIDRHRESEEYTLSEVRLWLRYPGPNLHPLVIVGVHEEGLGIRLLADWCQANYDDILEAHEVSSVDIARYMRLPK